jgi:hypothetical protein
VAKIVAQVEEQFSKELKQKIVQQLITADDDDDDEEYDQENPNQY